MTRPCVRVWDLETGALRQVLEGHEAPIYAVAITPDGARLVTGSRDMTARVWDIDPNTHPLRTLPELLHYTGTLTNYRA